MRALLAEMNRCLERDQPCVLCTVVSTRGSTPQKAGAAMLVYADGNQFGTLGGGCVEAEVKRQALQTLHEQADGSEVLSFCLDDNYGWDDGLICGGRMEILAEPLLGPTGSTSRHYFRNFHQRVEAGEGFTEAILVGGELGAVGSRYLFDAAGELVQQIASEPPPDVVQAGLVPLSGRPRAYHKAGVAYLPVLPRIALLIVGGGHVGQAVAKLAAEVDFEVWVLDDRASYASRERFPDASKHLVGDIGSTLAELRPSVTPRVYALIITRGHNHDEEALFHLATANAGYVGMIGSKRKIKLIRDDLLARGIPAECLDRVYAPIGLAIGSQTVPEIAVSIVAQLIARRNLGIASTRD